MSKQSRMVWYVEGDYLYHVEAFYDPTSSSRFLDIPKHRNICVHGHDCFDTESDAIKCLRGNLLTRISLLKERLRALA